MSESLHCSLVNVAIAMIAGSPAIIAAISSLRNGKKLDKVNGTTEKKETVTASGAVN